MDQVCPRAAAVSRAQLSYRELLIDHGNRRAEFDEVPLLGTHLSQSAISRSFDLDVDLIGLDFEQRFALFHGRP